MRQIVLHRRFEDIRGAVIENGTVVEWLFEGKMDLLKPGIIIKGKVETILPGMDAAFVNIGSEKNGFLLKKELIGSQHEEHKSKPITSLLKQGQSIIVQVKKEEFGTKGAKLTEQLSFPGKYLVYLPFGNYIAISKKISHDEDREQLRVIAQSNLENKEGIIFRTSAAKTSTVKLKAELAFLREQFTTTMRKAQVHEGITTLYNSTSVTRRVIRDFIDHEDTQFVVDDINDYKELTASLTSDEKDKVTLYQGKENLFSYFDLDKVLDKTLSSFLWLKNGGSLHIDYTEAMTIIDVNSAKFTSKQGLSDTAKKTNLDAVTTIAQQLRLRDIGGIILIDFIDMPLEKDRQEVMYALKNALKPDRTITNVLGFTQLGLLEMTRKKTRKAIHEIIYSNCNVCGGTGLVKSEAEVAAELEEALFAFRTSEAAAFVVDVTKGALPLFLHEGKRRLKWLEKVLSKRIFLNGVTETGFHIRFEGDEQEARNFWNKV
ncbi:Rne/Rng family ribonuclease [Salipaludibacillus agaradhaerens]|uniref:Rne/Rng family ribonuclease n=1 Tax=Salipaludibacillus agaradhaerens TaxID=76935 RepID=UPI0021513AAF|nr:Rne/Rng family ribonuclease [Salipaludibacillus agaradhaerens]MCR6119467.1 Rne/Rng family ribonuclease [Salipaludibacillus agaradhaerens]